MTRWPCPDTRTADPMLELIAIKQFGKVLGAEIETWTTQLTLPSGRAQTLDQRTGPPPPNGPQTPMETLAPQQWRPRASPSWGRIEAPFPLPSRQWDMQAPWAPFTLCCYRCHDTGHLDRNCPATMECGVASHYTTSEAAKSKVNDWEEP
ncbi:UNVERIFIED_CONTAM: hypothetical protein FKN15_054175 [Acipenser sinensis]